MEHSTTSKDQKQKRNRKRNVHTDLVSYIKVMHTLNYKAQEILETLQPLEKIPEFRGKVPPIWTIRRLKKDFDLEDQTAIWTWTKAGAEVAQLVLDTLREANHQTGGRVQSFTQKQADRIYQIRAAYPDIPPMYAYMVATTMTDDTGTGDTIDGPTGYLMHEPWKDREHMDRYRAAIRSGLVPKGPPMALVLDSDGEVKITDTRSAIHSVLAAGGFPVYDEESGFTVGASPSSRDPRNE